MAKTWNGFLPQNMEVKEQWGLLEESRKKTEIAWEDAFDKNPSDEPAEPDEADPSYVRIG